MEIGIPPEALSHILSHLPLRSLLKSSEASSNLYRLCLKSYLWRYLYHIHKFATPPYISKGIWKDLFVSGYKRRMSWKKGEFRNVTQDLGPGVLVLCIQWMMSLVRDLITNQLRIECNINGQRTIVWQHELNEEQIRSITVAAMRKSVVAVGFKNGLLLIRCPSERNNQVTNMQLNDEISSICVVPPFILCGFHSGGIQMIHVNGTILSSYAHLHEMPIINLHFEVKNEDFQIISASHDGKVKRIDSKAVEPIILFDGQDPILCISVDSLNSSFVVGCQSCTLKNIHQSIPLPSIPTCLASNNDFWIVGLLNGNISV